MAEMTLNKKMRAFDDEVALTVAPLISKRKPLLFFEPEIDHFVMAVTARPRRRGDRVKRREFITLLGGAAASTAWPLSIRAQQPEQMRRIGVLMGFPESDSQAQRYIAAFRDELHKLGWTEGRNVRIDTRWATPAEAGLMRQFAKELVAQQPDLMLSNTTPTTTALLQQTRTIPIVFATVADPVGSGFVASFPRPGGNVTGFAVSHDALGGKWLELLKEIAPRVARVAIVFNPAAATYAEFWLNSFKAAAPSFGQSATTCRACTYTARSHRIRCLRTHASLCSRGQDGNGSISPLPMIR